MLGNAHAAFKFVTPIIINVVTKTQRKREKKTERVYDASHAYHICCGVQKQKKKDQGTSPMDLTNNLNMRTRK